MHQTWTLSGNMRSCSSCIASRHCSNSWMMPMLAYRFVPERTQFVAPSVFELSYCVSHHALPQQHVAHSSSTGGLHGHQCRDSTR